MSAGRGLARAIAGSLHSRRHVAGHEEMALARRDNKRNTVRIIAGSLRGRRVMFPDSEGLRPTGDRIRETLFNWLHDVLAGARCLDLFAGSGALGIEAISRGAARVDLVENDPVVARVLAENLSALAGDRACLYRMDALRFIRGHSGDTGPYDVVFLDPPYDANCLGEVSRNLQAAGMLAGKALIYLEHSTPVPEHDLPVTWLAQRRKKAGHVYYGLYRSNQQGA